MRIGMYRLTIIRFGIAAFAITKRIGTYHPWFESIDVNLVGLGLVFVWDVIIRYTSISNVDRIDFVYFLI